MMTCEKNLFWPKGLPDNKSLHNFFEEVTHDLEDIVDSIVVTTNFKKEGTNFTNFVFSNDAKLIGTERSQRAI
jgi:hypothetical protein